MKFEFCGNVSCPEWFIAEISVLTKITAVKMKLVFSQLITYYLEGGDISGKVVKLLSGTGLDIYEMNAVISTLNFILHNSIQTHISDTTLYKQLIDLGLPKQNAESITKSYKSNREKLLQKSLQKMPKLSSHLQLQYSIHEFLGSYKLGTKAITPMSFIQMNLSYKDMGNRTQNIDFVVTQNDLENLIYELEQALAITQKVDIPK